LATFLRGITMRLPRRQFLHLAAGAAVAPAVSQTARAQTYPSRFITMIVPFPAGGNTDAIGRVVAERMRRLLGQAVIIENVSGADGSIGVGRAARARPDGYTIDLGMTATHVMIGAFYSLSYDVLNDFAPISPVTTDWRVLFAKKTMPAKDLKELIVWLKDNPNKASTGFTSVENHLVSALFQKQTGTQFALVPYRGFAPAMQDLLAGQIDLLFAAPDSLPLMRAGSIRAYAVTSDTRLALAPDIPTFDEMGLRSLSYSAWTGLFAPKGTPRDIIGKLNAAAVEALTDPAVRSRLADLGEEVFPRERQTPEVLGALVRADAEKWWPIIKESGIRAE
jgi:tripartite-type tricarboxylate transporter receptor subunit TctC